MREAVPSDNAPEKRRANLCIPWRGGRTCRHTVAVVEPHGSHMRLQHAHPRQPRPRPPPPCTTAAGHAAPPGHAKATSAQADLGARSCANRTNNKHGADRGGPRARTHGPTKALPTATRCVYSAAGAARRRRQEGPHARWSWESRGCAMAATRWREKARRGSCLYRCEAPRPQGSCCLRRRTQRRRAAGC